MTPDQAVVRLDEVASAAEYENYHSLAAIIWEDIIPQVRDINERAVVLVPTEWDGTFVRIDVEPAGK